MKFASIIFTESESILEIFLKCSKKYEIKFSDQGLSLNEFVLPSPLNAHNSTTLGLFQKKLDLF